MSRFALLLLLASLQPGSAQTIRLDVHLAPGVALDAASLQAIVEKAKLELSANCSNVRLTPGAIKALPTDLPADISWKDHSDTDAYRQRGVRMVVVNTIQQCGGKIYGLLGCGWSGTPDQRILAVKKQSTTEADALLFAHEIGHTLGLVFETAQHADYTSGHHRKWRYLMFSSPAEWAMDGIECAKAFGPQPAAATDTPDSPASADDEGEMPPKIYLRSLWVHGPDLDYIERHQKELGELATEAITGNNYALWPNSARILGLVQPEGTLDLLRSIILQPAIGAKEPQLNINDAKIVSIESLGLLAFQANTMFRELLDLANPNFAADALDFGTADLAEREAFARGAALAALQGLAYSGHPVSVGLLDNAEKSQLMGAYDLKVTEQFFSGLNTTSQAFRLVDDIDKANGDQPRPTRSAIALLRKLQNE